MFKNQLWFSFDLIICKFNFLHLCIMSRTRVYWKDLLLPTPTLCMYWGLFSDTVSILVSPLRPCVYSGFSSPTLCIYWFLLSDTVYIMVSPLRPCLYTGFSSSTLCIYWFLLSGTVNILVSPFRHCEYTGFSSPTLFI